MCTTIAATLPASGCAKGPQGWFALDHVYVTYDHPTHARLEHALNIDFVDEASGPGARVGVELSRESARELAVRILDSLEQANAYERSAGPAASRG